MARRRYLAPVLLACTLTAALSAAFWLGLVPPRFSPLAPLDLAHNDAWFLDFRLAALRADSALCQTVLKEPFIAASPVSDQAYKSGCGWHNGVRTTAAGGARLSAGQISCPMAAALAMWVAHDVQPEAERILGSRVVAIHHMGTYACRNIVGSHLMKPFRSQHATANAIDISGFALANGSTVTVLNGWGSDDAKGRFLRSVKKASCRYFRVSIGPDFNAAHANHFHFDRGAFKSCR